MSPAIELHDVDVQEFLSILARSPTLISNVGIPRTKQSCSASISLVLKQNNGFRSDHTDCLHSFLCRQFFSGHTQPPSCHAFP